MAPTTAGAASYAGPFRVPAGSRVVCAIAVAAGHDAGSEIRSEVIRIAIPQAGREAPSVDLGRPARWKGPIKLDDAGAVWDFIQRLEELATVIAYDLELTAESADKAQQIDYAGIAAGGYTAVNIKLAADKVQEIVGSGSLRMTIGALGFTTGQALLDWLKTTGRPFDAAKVGP